MHKNELSIENCTGKCKSDGGSKNDGDIKKINTLLQSDVS
jgi:hypothetical protein